MPTPDPDWWVRAQADARRQQDDVLGMEAVLSFLLPSQDTEEVPDA